MLPLIRVALLYQSTYSVRWAITQSSLIVGSYHFSVAINGGEVCTVAYLRGFWLIKVVSVVIPPLSVVFASGAYIRRSRGRGVVAATFA